MRGLTVTDETLERAESATVPGMAHWAGGANGGKCGDCRFFGYSYSKRDGDPARKNSSCEKFFKITGQHGGSIEKRQPGCKYFNNGSVAEGERQP